MPQKGWLHAIGTTEIYRRKNGNIRRPQRTGNSQIHMVLQHKLKHPQPNLFTRHLHGLLQQLLLLIVLSLMGNPAWPSGYTGRLGSSEK